MGMPVINNVYLFAVVENVFVAIYTLECVLWIHHLGMKFFRSPARLFDFVIVVISIVDACILTPLGSSTDLRLVKLLRILRLVRIIRLVRVLKAFKDLMGIMRALTLSASVLCLSFLFLLLFTLTYALFLKLAIDQLLAADSSPAFETYFGSNMRVSLTLFQAMTGSDVHEKILRPLDSYVVYILIVLCVVLVRFGLLSTVVGVIVLNVHNNEGRRAKEKIENSMRLSRREINEIVSVFVSPDKKIFLQPFLIAWNHPRVISKLRNLDLNHIDPRYLFSILDAERKGYVTVHELGQKLERIKRGAPLLPMKSLNDQLSRVSKLIDSIETKSKLLDISHARKTLTDLDCMCLELARQSKNEIVQKRLSGHVIRNFFS